MNEIMQIENLIHVIRGQQVMLDSDLARLYGVETKVLNQAVKRNVERFPEDFRFQLTSIEAHDALSPGLRSQIVTLNSKDSGLSPTSKSKRGQHTKYLPYAFTENGVAMLSGILRSDTAIAVNIRIMRAFTAMRSFLMNNAHVFQRLETVEHHQLLLQQHLSDHDSKFEEVLNRLDKRESEPIEGLFFEGQIFDAYTLVSDLVRMAHHRIILIDNYVDDRVLKILAKREPNVTATIYTNPRNTQILLDVESHNSQYPAIDLLRCTNVHDRFLIIDDVVYFIGGSIKDLGKKIVAFSRMHQNPQDIISKIK